MANYKHCACGHYKSAHDGKVSAVWKAAGPPLASIPVVGAPAKEKSRSGYLPPEAREAGESAAGSVE